jgi:hypothetical protein
MEKGSLLVTVFPQKILVDYCYPSSLSPNKKDWIALFSHNREISWCSYKELTAVEIKGRIAFSLPLNDGYYDVRLYRKGTIPEKGKENELIQSQPFLIGDRVELTCSLQEDHERSVFVAFSFTCAAKEQRTDSIRLYREGERSNRNYLHLQPLEIVPRRTKGNVSMRRPYLPGRYEFRYFINNVVHEFSGITTPFVVKEDDSVAVDYNIAEQCLRVQWKLYNCDPDTRGVFLNKEDWVALVLQGNEKMVQWKLIKREHRTDEEGEVTFDLKGRKWGEKVQGVAVHLHCHRQKKHVCQSKTVLIQ